MKNFFKNFVQPALLILCVLNANAQATSKTFSKSFNLDGATAIQVDLPGTVEVKTWDNATLRFVITVTLPGGNNNLSVIDQLASVGRYDLVLTEDSGNSTIEAKNLKRTIKVKGQDFKENVHFEVFVPKDVNIQTTKPAEIAVAKK